MSFDPIILSNDDYFQSLDPAKKTAYLEEVAKNFPDDQKSGVLNSANEYMEKNSRSTGFGRVFLQDRVLDTMRGVLPENFDELSKDEKVEAIDAARSKLTDKVKEIDPVNKNDTEFFADLQLSQMTREILGEDVGEVGDKVKRFTGGLIQSVFSPISETGTQEFLNRNLPTNPKNDATTASKFTTAAGDFVGQIGQYFAIAALAPETGGASLGLLGLKTASTGSRIAMSVGLAQNVSRKFQENYDLAKGEMGLSDDEALEAGLAGTPGALIDSFGDALLLRGIKLGSAGKAFSAMTATEKAAEIVAKGSAILKDPKAMNQIVKSAAEGFLKEGVSETLGDAATAWGGYATSGHEGFKPKAESLWDSFWIGGVLGGMAGGVLHSGSDLSNQRSLKELGNIDQEQFVSMAVEAQEQVAKFMDDGNYSGALQVINTFKKATASIQDEIDPNSPVEAGVGADPTIVPPKAQNAPVEPPTLTAAAFIDAALAGNIDPNTFSPENSEIRLATDQIHQSSAKARTVVRNLLSTEQGVGLTLDQAEAVLSNQTNATTTKEKVPSTPVKDGNIAEGSKEAIPAIIGKAETETKVETPTGIPTAPIIKADAVAEVPMVERVKAVRQSVEKLISKPDENTGNLPSVEVAPEVIEDPEAAAADIQDLNDELDEELSNIKKAKAVDKAKKEKAPKKEKKTKKETTTSEENQAPQEPQVDSSLKSSIAKRISNMVSLSKYKAGILGDGSIIGKVEQLASVLRGKLESATQDQAYSINDDLDAFANGEQIISKKDIAVMLSRLELLARSPSKADAANKISQEINSANTGTSLFQGGSTTNAVPSINKESEAFKALPKNAQDVLTGLTPNEIQAARQIVQLMKSLGIDGKASKADAEIALDIRKAVNLGVMSPEMIQELNGKIPSRAVFHNKVMALRGLGQSEKANIMLQFDVMAVNSLKAGTSLQSFWAKMPDVVVVKDTAMNTKVELATGAIKRGSLDVDTNRNASQQIEEAGNLIPRQRQELERSINQDSKIVKSAFAPVPNTVVLTAGYYTAATLIHEVDHNMIVTGQAQSIIESQEGGTELWNEVLGAVGATRGEFWSVASHEKWTNAREAWIRNGKSVSTVFQKVFKALKGIFTRLYADGVLDKHRDPVLEKAFEKIYAIDKLPKAELRNKVARENGYEASKMLGNVKAKKLVRAQQIANSAKAEKTIEAASKSVAIQASTIVAGKPEFTQQEIEHIQAVTTESMTQQEAKKAEPIYDENANYFEEDNESVTILDDTLKDDSNKSERSLRSLLKSFKGFITSVYDAGKWEGLRYANTDDLQLIEDAIEYFESEIDLKRGDLLHVIRYTGPDYQYDWMPEELKSFTRLFMNVSFIGHDEILSTLEKNPDASIFDFIADSPIPENVSDSVVQSGNNTAFIGKVDEAINSGLQRNARAINPNELAQSKIEDALDGLELKTRTNSDGEKVYTKESKRQIAARLDVLYPDGWVVKSSDGYAGSGIYTKTGTENSVVKRFESSSIVKAEYLVERFDAGIANPYGEYRVHGYVMNGVLSIVPYATSNRSHTPYFIRTNTVISIENAALDFAKGMTNMQEGDVFGFDVSVTPEGKLQVVEVNQTQRTNIANDIGGGMSGYLENPMTSLAVAAHIQGRVPPHVLIARAAARSAFSKQSPSVEFKQKVENIYANFKDYGSFVKEMVRNFGEIVREYVYQIFASLTKGKGKLTSKSNGIVAAIERSSKVDAKTEGEEQGTSLFQMADILKLTDDESTGQKKNVLQKFATTFADKIKGADKTIQDVRRIATSVIDDFIANPQSKVAIPTKETLDPSTYLRMSDGTMYDPKNPIHAVEASPETLMIHNAIESKNIDSVMSKEAKEIGKQRIESIGQLASYLKGNDDYTPEEAALILVGSSRWGYTGGKDGVINLVAMTKSNRVLIPIVGGDASIVKDFIKEDMSFKDAFKSSIEAAIKNQIEANVKSNKNGWVQHEQSEETENAVALMKDCAGTDWCTGKSSDTAQSHLTGGDFYVYFRDGKPEIAIRTEYGEIREVRGTGKGQSLIEDQDEIAYEYMKGNRDIKKSEDYISDVQFKKDVTKAIRENDTEFLAMLGMMNWEIGMGVNIERKFSGGVGYGQSNKYPLSLIREIEKHVPEEYYEDGIAFSKQNKTVEIRDFHTFLGGAKIEINKFGNYKIKLLGANLTIDNGAYDSVIKIEKTANNSFIESFSEVKIYIPESNGDVYIHGENTLFEADVVKSGTVKSNNSTAIINITDLSGGRASIGSDDKFGGALNVENFNDGSIFLNNTESATLIQNFKGGRLINKSDNSVIEVDDFTEGSLTNKSKYSSVSIDTLRDGRVYLKGFDSKMNIRFMSKGSVYIQGGGNIATIGTLTNGDVQVDGDRLLDEEGQPKVIINELSNGWVYAGEYGVAEIKEMQDGFVTANGKNSLLTIGNLFYGTAQASGEYSEVRVKDMRGGSAKSTTTSSRVRVENLYNGYFGIPGYESARAIIQNDYREDSQKKTGMIFQDNLIIEGQETNDAKEDVLDSLINEEEQGTRLYQQGEVRSQQDQDYLDAVERGDMETAQKMVDEAAKKAGYITKAFHATSLKFNEFKKSFDKSKGFWFSSKDLRNPIGATELLSVYIKGDPKIWKSGEAELKKAFRLYPDMWNDSPSGVFQTDDKEFGGTSYLVKSSKQIKSSDPVTYKESGEIILPSERFDTENNSILYQSGEARQEFSKEEVRAIIGMGQAIIQHLHKSGLDKKDIAKVQKMVKGLIDSMNTESGKAKGVSKKTSFNNAKKLISKFQELYAAASPEAAKELKENALAMSYAVENLGLEGTSFNKANNIPNSKNNSPEQAQRVETQKLIQELRGIFKNDRSIGRLINMFKRHIKPQFGTVAGRLAKLMTRGVDNVMSAFNDSNVDLLERFANNVKVYNGMEANITPEFIDEFNKTIDEVESAMFEYMARQYFAYNQAYTEAAGISPEIDKLIESLPRQDGETAMDYYNRLVETVGKIEGKMYSIGLEDAEAMNSQDAGKQAAAEKRIKKSRQKRERIAAQRKASLLEKFPTFDDLLAYKREKDGGLLSKDFQLIYKLSYDWILNASPESLSDDKIRQLNNIGLTLLVGGSNTQLLTPYIDYRRANLLQSWRDTVSGIGERVKDNKFTRAIYRSAGRNNALQVLMNNFDKGIQAKVENFHVWADRLSKYAPVRAWFDSQFFGDFQKGAFIEAENASKASRDQLHELVKQYNDETDTTVNANPYIWAMSMLSQYNLGTDPNKSFGAMVTKAYTSIDRSINKSKNSRIASEAQRNKAALDYMLDGVDLEAENSYDQFMEKSFVRIGNGDAKLASKRLDLMAAMSDMFQVDVANQIFIREVIHGESFVTVANYLPFKTQQVDGTPEEISWVDIEPQLERSPSAINVNKKSNDERQLSLGANRMVGMDVFQMVERKLIKNAIDKHSSLSGAMFREMFRYKKVKINNVEQRVPVDPVIKEVFGSGIDVMHEIDVIKSKISEQMVQIFGVTEPPSEITSGIKKALAFIQSSMLSGIGQVAQQSASAVVDYSLREQGNVSYMMDAIIYWSQNYDKVRAWMKINARDLYDRANTQGIIENEKHLTRAGTELGGIIDSAGDKLDAIRKAMTISLRYGDKLGAEWIFLAEQRKALEQGGLIPRGAQFDIDDYTNPDVTARAMGQLSRFIGTSSAAGRSWWMSDHKQSYYLLRSISGSFQSSAHNMSSQIISAARNVAALANDDSKEGKSERLAEMRKIGSIMAQQATFTGMRFMITGMLTYALAGAIKDAWDDEDGAISEAELALTKARKKVYPSKADKERAITIAERQLADAKAIRRAVIGMKQQASGDALFKSMVRDQLANLHIVNSVGDGFAAKPFMMIPNILMEKSQRDANDIIIGKLKKEKSNAIAVGDSKKAARINEDITNIQAIEYIPFFYEKKDKSGFGGIIGGALDPIYGAVKEGSEDITRSDKDFLTARAFIPDIITYMAAIGIGQADVNRVARALQRIDDEVSKNRDEADKRAAENVKELTNKSANKQSTIRIR